LNLILSVILLHLQNNMKQKQVLLEGKILTYYENLLWQKEWVLVFLHGWMQDGKSFSDICKILEEKNIAYVSIDFPWFWGSQLRHDDMTIEEYGKVVIDFLEKLQLKNAILIGHSFGGRVSIYLASFYTNIESIILICAAWIAKKISIPKYFVVKTWKIILSFPWLRSIGKKVRKWFSSPDLINAGKMEKIFRNTIALDLQDTMKSITLPSLMIWWKDDNQTPLHEWNIMHKLIRGSILQVLEWTHFIHQEKPETLAEMILNFTKK